ncbi:MAG: DUF4249 family protein [Bacteroidales bacterium]|nr:DUF4249 family protein [Bacteroidales bacterium]
MKRALLFLCTTVLFSVSCIRELTLDPGEEPMVVVDCVLSAESPQALRLFYSRPPSYSEMTPITDAEVELIDKTDGMTAGLFVHRDGREWTLDYSAVPEHEYRLEIRIPGHDLVYAEDVMPAAAKIESKIWDLGIDPFRVSQIKFNEDCEFGASFYGIAYRILPVDQYVWIYAMNYNSEKGNHVIANEICTNSPLVDNFNLLGESYKPSVFKHSLGVYGSFSFESELYPQLTGEALHNRFLRFHNNTEENGDVGWFLISGSFDGRYSSSGKGNYGFLSCVTVSEAYDLYLRDAIRIQQLEDSSDLVSVYYRDNIYSNIVGGLGIFGFSNQIILPWIQGWNYESPDIPVPGL